MNNTKKLLRDYYEILNDNRIAKFLICKNTPVYSDKTDSTNNLWKIHDEALNNIRSSVDKSGRSLLDLKIELSQRIFENCHFCERRCGINRNKKIGNCRVEKTKIASEFLHIGEERVLIPSHTIFFSGCTFHCVFCQNWDISQDNSGIYIEPEKLASIIHYRKEQGARNVNWVGGDPTPNLVFILQTLNKCSDNTPQIWNSNMYCSIETMKLLNGVIDLYLTDFKYGNDKCAERLSKVDNYMEIVKRNHKIAYENGEIIIRHLVMPNHIECCSKPIIKWISENLPNAVVNIMEQFRPEYHAVDYNDISRYLSMGEIIKVKDHVHKFNIHQI